MVDMARAFRGITVPAVSFSARQARCRGSNHPRWLAASAPLLIQGGDSRFSCFRAMLLAAESGTDGSLENPPWQGGKHRRCWGVSEPESKPTPAPLPGRGIGSNFHQTWRRRGGMKDSSENPLYRGVAAKPPGGVPVRSGETSPSRSLTETLSPFARGNIFMHCGAALAQVPLLAE